MINRKLAVKITLLTVRRTAKGMGHPRIAKVVNRRINQGVIGGIIAVQRPVRNWKVSNYELWPGEPIMDLLDEDEAFGKRFIPR